MMAKTCLRFEQSKRQAQEGGGGGGPEAVTVI